MTAQAHKSIIAVIGGSSATEAEMAKAEAIGKGLAERGAILVCGGRGGIMEAACRGTREGGGIAVGILPGVSESEANPYVEIPIVTGMGEARNIIIARSAHAVIAIGGSYGTLSEIAYALRFGTPVIGVGTWHMDRETHVLPPIHRVDSPEEAVALALELANQATQGGERGERSNCLNCGGSTSTTEEIRR
jgi:uncharacterized protein (TIGR00725 family)